MGDPTDHGPHFVLPDPAIQLMRLSLHPISPAMSYSDRRRLIRRLLPADGSIGSEARGKRTLKRTRTQGAVVTGTLSRFGVVDLRKVRSPTGGSGSQWRRSARGLARRGAGRSAGFRSEATSRKAVTNRCSS